MGLDVNSTSTFKGKIDFATFPCICSTKILAANIFRTFALLELIILKYSSKYFSQLILLERSAGVDRWVVV